MFSGLVLALLIILKPFVMLLQELMRVLITSDTNFQLIAFLILGLQIFSAIQNEFNLTNQNFLCEIMQIIFCRCYTKPHLLRKPSISNLLLLLFGGIFFYFKRKQYVMTEIFFLKRHFVPQKLHLFFEIM